MALVMSWVCIVCVVLGGTLGRASQEAEFGLSIHPIFSSSVYIAKEPETFKDLPAVKGLEVEEILAKECEILNTTESGRGLHMLKIVPRRSFSFFVKPEPSFKRLVFKLTLQGVMFISHEFYSDEDLTLDAEDLTSSEGSQWTKVRVEHYQFKRRGFDRHAFKISFGNTTLRRETTDSWLLNGFQDFTMFSKGGAIVVFNCDPEDFNRPSVENYVIYSTWVMAGLMIVATFLLAALCCVWLRLKHQRKERSSSIKYPIYDEFGEEVLERVRQKVEALRNGKHVKDPDTVIVSYPPRKENLYVVDISGYGETDGVRAEDHQYEDIEKYYKHSSVTDNVYYNTDDDIYCGSAIDNIYESLSCYEEYEVKRDEGRGFARY
ncbi:uncharacterized protein LOC123505411 [Portunus trituberculatus]|uniref:Uncharacterized protein n=1 Tax=Portunus trituberculatus TaxID=210409 RepID=A0A5B7HND2_PORTR|nr:uncharacterized protein LOC123505411 [Portunus trituberculatus]MPC71239.1 hypothetical protein [Portunus trituberculatus]